MRVLIVTVCVIIGDQLTKLLVKGVTIAGLAIHWEGMRYGSSVPVIGDFLRWTYIENAGMAFGIDPGGGKLFFSIFAIAASLLILFFIYLNRKETLFLRIPLALILGGAIGNLIDRTFYGMIFDGTRLFTGRVVDFIDVDFFNITFLGRHFDRWPVFNIADAAVTTGVLILLIFSRRVMRAREADTLPIASPPGDIVTAEDPREREHQTEQ